MAEDYPIDCIPNLPDLQHTVENMFESNLSDDDNDEVDDGGTSINFIVTTMSILRNAIIACRSSESVAQNDVNNAQSVTRNCNIIPGTSNIMFILCLI